MSEGSDEEIITPVGKNKRTRPFNSDCEHKLVTNDFNENRQTKKIREQHSSSEDEDTDDYREKNGETYIQKVRKIKRDTGEIHYTQTENIIAAKVFQNKDCRCRKACIKNYEEERKNTFEKFWYLGDFNKQNILLYKATERYAVERKRQKKKRKRFAKKL